MQTRPDPPVVISGEREGGDADGGREHRISALEHTRDGCEGRGDFTDRRSPDFQT